VLYSLHRPYFLSCVLTVLCSVVTTYTFCASSCNLICFIICFFLSTTLVTCFYLSYRLVASTLFEQLYVYQYLVNERALIKLYALIFQVCVCVYVLVFSSLLINNHPNKEFNRLRRILGETRLTSSCAYTQYSRPSRPMLRLVQP